MKEMRADMKGLRTDVKGLRTEVGADVKAVRTELKAHGVVLNKTADNTGALLQIVAADAVAPRGSLDRPRSVSVRSLLDMVALLAPVVPADVANQTVAVLCGALTPQVRCAHC
jgi:hypothetical protein